MIIGDRAISSGGNFNWFLYFCVFTAHLLALSSGIGFSWPSSAVPILYKGGSSSIFSEPITQNQEAWIIGLLNLGSACGPLLAGTCAHKYGRKKALIISAILTAASFMVMAYAPSIEYCLAARFIQGLGSGFMFTALPMYTGEVTETSSRGAFGCMLITMTSVGVLISYTVGTFTNLRLYTMICSSPSILFLLTFALFAPESPYYYITRKNPEAALNSLSKLRNSIEGIEKTKTEMNEYFQKSKADGGGFKELIDSRRGVRSLSICIGVMFFQQFGGIAAVLASMQSILDASDSGIPGGISTIVIAVINIVINVVASQLADRLGRKTLFIISSSGSTVSLTCLAVFYSLKDHGYSVVSINWLPVVSLAVYILTFGLGLGPLPWTITAELFPCNLRAICATITVITDQMLCFVVTFSYPHMNGAFGLAGGFCLFAICTGVSILFFYYLLPETKGKTFEEIQTVLGND